MSRPVEILYEAPMNTQKVFCTGPFDDWKGKFEMTVIETNHKERFKKFFIKINVPNKQNEVTFKFIVDGTWKLSSQYKKTGTGSFENNQLFLDPPSPAPVPTSSPNFPTESNATSLIEKGDENWSSSKDSGVAKSLSSLYASASETRAPPGYLFQVLDFFTNCMKGRPDKSEKEM